jgi:insulysin
VAAVKSYLIEDLAVSIDKAASLLEEGLRMLDLMPKAEEVAVEAPKKEPYVIENVRTFKASLPVSAGATPVKDLSEFEELDAKL